jgi:hypothetical protein
LKRDSIFGEDCILHEIAELDDILPLGLFIIEEKIPMLLTDSHSTNTSSFESRFIDKFSCRKSWRILEKTSTRKTCWLFFFASNPESIRSV